MKTLLIFIDPKRILNNSQATRGSEFLDEMYGRYDGKVESAGTAYFPFISSIIFQYVPRHENSGVQETPDTQSEWTQ